MVECNASRFFYQGHLWFGGCVPKPSEAKRDFLRDPVLRDTARLSQRYPPSLRAMGVLVSQHGQLGAIPPPPFLNVSPLESMRSGGAITPPTKGASQRYLRDTLRKKAKRVRYPLCDAISKGIALYGGVSRTGPLRSQTIVSQIVAIPTLIFNRFIGGLVAMLLAFCEFKPRTSSCSFS